MSRRKKLKYSISIIKLLILILGVIMLLPMAKAYHDHDYLISYYIYKI